MAFLDGLDSKQEQHLKHMTITWSKIQKYWGTNTYKLFQGLIDKKLLKPIYPLTLFAKMKDSK